MLKTILIWILAFIITAATAIYQRMTGPTYPLSGELKIAQSNINYKFLRSENVGTDLLIKFESQYTNLTAITYWKRYKTNDDFTPINMINSDGVYKSTLPSQPAAGKLEYYVEVIYNNQSINLPSNENVVARYKGRVPTTVLIFHVIAMFGAMLLSTRTGLEFFRKEPKLNKLTLWTIGFLFVGGLILGPIVQKYAFDAYWTGWPFGHDLTDNKTAVALIGWVIAFVMYKKSKHPKRWALGAAIVLMIVYLIPHSVLGSELDYNKLDKLKNNDPQNLQDSINLD
jgi:hypothetical protein